MNKTYFLCSLTMSYVDLCLYDTYVGRLCYDYDDYTMNLLLSRMLMLCWLTILRWSYDVVLAFMLDTFFTKAYCLQSNQM